MRRLPGWERRGPGGCVPNKFLEQCGQDARVPGLRHQRCGGDEVAFEAKEDKRPRRS